MFRRFQPIQSVRQREPFNVVETTAYLRIQFLQSYIWVRMGFEQQCHAIIIFGIMTDLLQHTGQAKSIITGTRRNLGTANNQLLNFDIVADQAID